MATGVLAAKERGAGTQRQQQSCFTAHETNRSEQLWKVCDPQIDMDTGGDDPGAIGRFDQGVVRVAGVGSFEPLTVAETECAAW